MVYLTIFYSNNTYSNNICLSSLYTEYILNVIYFNCVVEYSELQIADENILQFDVSKVMKRGGSTGETEGLLTGNTLSVCVDKDLSSGGFYHFDRCFSIESSGRPFFEKGDSGSGVFLIENGRPTKPLGIAFAKLSIKHITAVCRIDKIAEVFGLSLYQNEEPKEAVQHEEPMEIC